MGLSGQIGKFFSSRFNLGLVAVLVVIGLALALTPVPEEADYSQAVAVVHYFFLPGCPHCAEQEPVIRELQEEMPDVLFVFHDGSTSAGMQKYIELASAAGMNTAVIQTPTIFLKDAVLVGVHSKEEIRQAIVECIERCRAGASEKPGTTEKGADFTSFELPFIGRVNLLGFSLPALAVVLGLIDGFNPCAMWVLVYLIALLVEVDDKRKMWLIVGSFVLASGALYFLLMTAWLNAFLLLGYIRALTIAIGLVALGGGAVSVRQFVASRGRLECKAAGGPSSLRTIQRLRDIVARPVSLSIIAAIVVLAFVVNSIEFVCSSAIPAVFTQILALSGVSLLEKYAYILLYDFFFMLDDIIIFSMAVLAVNSSFGERYAKYCRLVGGILLVLLGVLLLFAPNVMV